MKCEIAEFPDGTLCLELGDEGMETDLVFASGCMRGDPGLEEQRAMLQELVNAWDYYTLAKNRRANTSVSRLSAARDGYRNSETEDSP